ncbi:MAG: hypothetical protein D6820_02740 [Lentisphaerae bacterium]|nr:MAG: hypothetical protein D6820_02740 [Lentisphaerota bacterium]
MKLLELIQTDSINIVFSIALLLVSLHLGRSIIKQAYRYLSEEEFDQLKTIFRQHYPFQLIPFIFLIIYFVSRNWFLENNLATVLALWICYNIFLWIKMRWFMKRFQENMFPPKFQVSFILGQILSYTGVVVAMLILLRGKNL